MMTLITLLLTTLAGAQTVECRGQVGLGEHPADQRDPQRPSRRALEGSPGAIVALRQHAPQPPPRQGGSVPTDVRSRAGPGRRGGPRVRRAGQPAARSVEGDLDVAGRDAEQRRGLGGVQLEEVAEEKHGAGLRAKGAHPLHPGGRHPPGDGHRGVAGGRIPDGLVLEGPIAATSAVAIDGLVASDAPQPGKQRARRVEAAVAQRREEHVVEKVFRLDRVTHQRPTLSKQRRPHRVEVEVEVEVGGRLGSARVAGHSRWITPDRPVEPTPHSPSTRPTAPP